MQGKVAGKYSLIRLCLAIGCFVLASHAQTPKMDLVLILDASTTTGRQVETIKTGAHPATYEIHDGDRVSVMSYTKKAKIIQPFTEDPAQVEQAIQKVSTPLFKNAGRHCLNDALFEAFRQFPQKSEPERKRIIGIITNNLDSGSVHSIPELIEAAKAKNIAVWVFLVPVPKLANTPLSGIPAREIRLDLRFVKEQLDLFAEETGGGVRIIETNGYTLSKVIAVCKGDPR
jgi:hypothetical protein